MRSSYASQPVSGTISLAPVVPDCPSCGSRLVRLVGPIPAAVEFAGRHVDVPLEGGWLWDCRGCTLMFRHPALPKFLRDQLYGETNEDAWRTPVERRVDWALARAHLSHFHFGGKILDIGCYDGRFLLSLEGRWERHGIELNRKAATRASAAGITIVGSDFADLALLKSGYDALTAFDVIEHVENPAKFLTACARAMQPDGLLIIATGNSRSFSWRLLRSRNLYCIYSEHLVFVNPEYCARMAPQAGLRLVSTKLYRRSEGSWLTHIADAAKSVAYSLSPSVIASLRRRGVGKLSDPVKVDYPPLWPSAKDHFLAVFMKIAA